MAQYVARMGTKLTRNVGIINLIDMKVFIRYSDGKFFAGFTTYRVDGSDRKSPSFGNYFEAKQMDLDEARETFKNSLVPVEFVINTNIVGAPKFKVIN